MSCDKNESNGASLFFYQGKCFEKEEEFWECVKEFSCRQTTHEDFDGIFDSLKRDVWINLSIRETPITNAELQAILQEVLVIILKKCWRKNGVT